MFQEILAPTNCPSCDSILVWENDLLYCRSTTCDAQQAKAMEHFAKTMKIKGLGPSSLHKLGWVCPSEIYSATKQSIAQALSSEKLADKLYAEIENSRSAPLELVLPAFSIPLIGKTATEKLSKVCNDITEINEETCEKAGLGPKATESLVDWLYKDFYCYFDGILPFSFKFTSSATANITGVVCISGKLKSFKTKAEATTALNQAGYEVKSSLTKQVTILVNESGIESSKTKQARDSGVTIVTDLKTFLEN